MAILDSPVRYTKGGDVHLAYRIFGNGPREIVLIPGTLSHLELTWEKPSATVTPSKQKYGETVGRLERYKYIASK